MSIYQWEIQEIYIPNYNLIITKSYKTPTFLPDQDYVSVFMDRILTDKQCLLSKVNNLQSAHVRKF